MRDEFTDDGSETAVGSVFTGHELEPRTPYRNPKTKQNKTKKIYSSHGESLKSKYEIF